jgi:hypothetical protein
MHVPISVKSPNNISEWQMGFNSAFKGLKLKAKWQHCVTKMSSTNIMRLSQFYITVSIEETKNDVIEYWTPLEQIYGPSAHVG